MTWLLLTLAGKTENGEVKGHGNGEMQTTFLRYAQFNGYDCGIFWSSEPSFQINKSMDPVLLRQDFMVDIKAWGDNVKSPYCFRK